MFGPQHAPAGQSCLKWACRNTQSDSICLQHTKSIRFVLQHAPADQSCMKWALKEHPEFLQLLTTYAEMAKMAKLNHVWSTPCPSRSIIPEVGLQKAPRVPPSSCHSSTCAKMAKINHVWPTACLMWFWKAPRVPLAACQTPTCGRIAKIIQHAP
jgi:hypothetical protein